MCTQDPTRDYLQVFSICAEQQVNILFAPEITHRVFILEFKLKLCVAKVLEKQT